jgi:hypothetical protein
VNQLPKSVVQQICTLRSVGAGSGRPLLATRWDEKPIVGTVTTEHTVEIVHLLPDRHVPYSPHQVL